MSRSVTAGNWLGRCLASALSVLPLAGCGTLITPETGDDPTFAASVGGLVSSVPVRTQPPSAPVAVNGRVIGFAPVMARLEVNRDGDLVDDIVISAEFPGGETVSESFTRGTKPPSLVTLSPGGGSTYLGR